MGWVRGIKSVGAGACVLSALLGAFSSSRAWANKKTVCSITLNSKNEIQAFKKNLNPNEFDFVELTEVESEAASPSSRLKPWLENACDQKISCDVLVVSGHFGGRFFGDSSDKTIEIETLEKLSCKATCQGLFSQLKEVFLFGCNTLANKERDSRTPTEYVSVLVDHGFTHEQAQTMAAFRYSPIGNSFRDRMVRIFSNTPMIAGFSSLSPLGNYVGPSLSDYLNKTGGTYAKTLDSLNFNDEKLLSAEARKLSGYFSGTSFTIAAGAEMSFDEKNHQIPACFLGNPQISLDGKLDWIEEQISTDAVLNSIVPISVFLNSTLRSGTLLTSSQRATLERVHQNSQAKERLLFLFDNFVSGLLRIQINILNFYRQVNWFNEVEYKTRIDKLITMKKALSTKLDVGWVDTVCSVETDIDVKMEDIPQARWSENDLFRLLGCIKPQDPKIKAQFFTTLESHPDIEKRWIAASYITSLITQDDLDRVIADLAKEQKRIATSAVSSSVTEKLAMSFKNLDVSTRVGETLELIKNSKHYWESYFLIKALARVQTFSQVEIESILDLYDKTSDPAYVEILTTHVAKYPDLLERLLILLKESSNNKTLSIMWMIKNMGSESQSVQDAFLARINTEISDSNDLNLCRSLALNLTLFKSLTVGTRASLRSFQGSSEAAKSCLVQNPALRF